MLAGCDAAVPVTEDESSTGVHDGSTSSPPMDSSVPPSQSTTTPVPPPPTTATSPADTGDLGDSSSGGSGSSSVTGDTDPSCGDEEIQEGEQCDGPNLQGFTCATLGLEGGELACDPDQCTFDTSGCGPELPDCGDGVVQPGEHCDGMDLQAFDCGALGLGDGVLACELDCVFDVSGCSGMSSCGNGRLDGGEECDGEDLQGLDCGSLGLGTGDLGCDPIFCNFDISDCTGA